ncbi:MAG: immunoglobulin-like domain-containing protein [Bacilli bacterium]
MKKIVIALLISLTSILLLTGCTNEIDKLITVESDIKIEDSNVTLKVKEDTLTKTGATFILENNKNTIINYTIAYEIEAKRDNKWYKLGIINEFIEEIYEVDAKSTDQIIIDWKNSYLKLPKGEYRVIKEITVPSTYELFYIAAEFTIK